MYFLSNHVRLHTFHTQLYLKLGQLCYNFTSISMELTISTSLLHSVSRTSLLPNAPEYTYRTCIYSFKRSRHKLKCNSKPLKVELSRNSVENVWEDSKFVEVIAIGSRRDAVLDFCLDSPLRCSALRFWYILLTC